MIQYEEDEKYIDNIPLIGILGGVGPMAGVRLHTKIIENTIKVGENVTKIAENATKVGEDAFKVGEDVTKVEYTVDGVSTEYLIPEFRQTLGIQYSIIGVVTFPSGS